MRVLSRSVPLLSVSILLCTLVAALPVAPIPRPTLPTHAATARPQRATDALMVPGTHSYRSARYIAPGAQIRQEVVSPSSRPSAIGSPYTSIILADHPSIYYRLDEAASPIAFDSSGHGQNGQYGADVTYNVPGALAGDPDTAVSGTAEILSVPSTALPSGSAARSYEMWFKASTVPSILLRHGPLTLTIYDTDDRVDHININVSGNTNYQLPYNIRDGRWHYFVLTYDGASTVSFYLDGQLTITLNSSLNTAPTDSFSVGGPGNYDEVAVYPAALTAADINAHWTRGDSPSRPCATTPTGGYARSVLADHPAVYLPLKDLNADNTARVAYDASGNCRNGAYNPSATNDPGDGPPGNPSGALSLTSGPGVLVGGAPTPVDSPLPSGSAARSYEMWFKASTVPSILLRHGPLTLTIYDTDDRVDHININVSGNTNYQLPYNIRDGRWHYFVLTYDGASTVSFYLDGQLTITLNSSLNTAPTDSFSVGGPGNYDEVAVYPAALTAADINAHWTRGDSPSRPCATTPTGGYARSVLADHPAVYLPLKDRGTGGAVQVAYDASGNCRNGAYNPSATNDPGDGPPGNPSGALSLTSGPGVLVGGAPTPVDSPLPSGSAARSYEFWFKTSTRPGGPFYASILLRQGPLILTIYDTDDGVDHVNVNVSGNSNYPLPYNIHDGQWHYFVLTYDHASAFSFYLDGHFVTTFDNTMSTAPTDPLGVGGYPGNYDEVAVYPTVLSADRIMVHFQAAGYSRPIDSLFGPFEHLSSCNPAEPAACPCQHCAADPVNTATGNFGETFGDIAIPGRGLPLAFSHTYNALAAAIDGPLGFGWIASYVMSLAQDSGTGAITVTQENGSQVTFTLTGTSYTAPPRVMATLVKNADGTFTFTRVAREIFTFSAAGRLTKEQDLNGYATTFGYNAAGQLIIVTDPAGHTLTLGWTGPHITIVTDPIGRQVFFGYNDGQGNLTDVTDVAGGVTHFTYDAAHLLLTRRDPRGGVVTNHYDASNRVDWQSDPLHRTTTFSYTVDSTGAQTTTITDPKGNATVDQYHYGLRTAVTRGYGTPQAATWRYTYDPATLGMTSMTDPNGHVTTMTYDASGNVLSRIDPLGRTTDYAYDALNDTTAMTDPLGVVTRMTYDGQGNLLSTSRPVTATTVSPDATTAAAAVSAAHATIARRAATSDGPDAPTSANSGAFTLPSLPTAVAAFEGVVREGSSLPRLVIASGCLGASTAPPCATGVHDLSSCARRCSSAIGAAGDRGRPAKDDALKALSSSQGQPVSALLDTSASRRARTPTPVPSRALSGSRKANITRRTPSCFTSRTRCATATLRRPVPPSAGYRSRDTVISVDDSAQGSGVDRFRYVGLWGHCKPCRDGARIGMYDRSSSVSRRAGDYYTLAFRGTGIALYSVHGPTHGIEEVTLDGRHHVLIDLYSARRTGDVLDHQYDQYAHLADGVHVLTVRVTGRKNKKSGNVYVVVDRVAITLAGIIPPRHTPTPLAATATRVATRIPTSTPTTTPRSTATPAPTAMPPTTTASAQPAPAAPTPATPTATATPTPTPTSTATMVMPTATGTQTPTDTPTVTPVPPTTTSTATATMTPATSTPTAMPPSATATGTLEAGATLPAGTTVPATTGTPASPATTTSPAATVMAESTATSTFAPTTATTATPSAATASPTTTSTQTSVPSPTATTTPLPSIPCADAGPYTATVCLTYDPAHPGDVIARTDPDGHTTRYTYDATGDLASVSDPLGDTTTYGYDLIGRKTSMTRPLGNVAGGNPTNYTTTMTYNAFGKTTAMTDAEGNLTTFGYDANQNLITTTDPLGRQTIDGYDLDNERTSVTRPDGVVLQTRYDGAGNVLTTTDGLSRSTSFVYDALNRLISTTAPLGRTTVYTYDLAGNKIASTDPLSQTTAYTYNQANELVGVLRSDGTSLTTGYDLDGRIASQTDGRGSTTSYGYDSLSRTVAVIDGLGRVTAYGYDLAGNRTALMDPMGRTIAYAYDAANRLANIAYSDGSTPAVQYSYNADGDRTAMRDGTGMTRYVYDTLDRTTSVIDGAGQAVGYRYNQVGELITLIYPGGQQVARAYDTLGRVTNVTDWLGHTTAFGYDGNGNVVSETYPNASSAILSYNEASDLTGITDTVNEAPRWMFGYDRNSLGQVSSVRDGIDGSAHTYGYDTTHRLTSDSGSGGAQGWAYDAADNLAAITTTAGTRAFAYDQANKLTALTTTIGAATASVAYTYNADGDRTGQSDGAAGTRATFGWDQVDRLVTATVGTTTTAIYVYDGDGLRQSKTVTATDGTTTTAETWDTAEGLPQLVQNGSMRYVMGPLGPIEQIDASDVPTYYYQDQLGSTRGLVDGAGATVGTYSYDPYGNVTEHTGVSTPLQYAGQYTDGETNLQYLRARYYDPATAQFLSRDPIKEVTGQSYGYGQGSPLDTTDPSGQCPWCVIAIGAAIGAVVNVAVTAVTTGGHGSLGQYAAAAGAGAAAGAAVTVAPVLAVGGAIAGVGVSVAVTLGQDGIKRQPVTGAQMVAAVDSGAISGAIGGIAGPLGGTLAKGAGFVANGLVAKVATVGISAAAGALAQASANGIDPCDQSSVANAALFGGLGGAATLRVSINGVMTIKQAESFAPRKSLGALLATASARRISTSYGISAGVGGGSLFGWPFP